MYQAAVNSYQQTNFLTANPARLVIMCYDGAIRSLKLARKAYIAKDYEAKAKALQKSLDIIYELNSSLDMQRGGAVAQNLRALYTYLTNMLIEADLKRDIDLFDKAIQMLEELHTAWKTIGTNQEEISASASYGGMSAVNGKAASVNQGLSV